MVVSRGSGVVGGAASVGLPAVSWTTHTTPDGRTYYHNAKTGVTTYDKPDELKTAAERALRCDWAEFPADGGKRAYYHNKVTGQTTWDEPAEFKAYKAALAAAAVAAAPAGASGALNGLPHGAPAPVPSPAPAPAPAPTRSLWGPPVATVAPTAAAVAMPVPHAVAPAPAATSAYATGWQSAHSAAAGPAPASSMTPQIMPPTGGGGGSSGGNWSSSWTSVAASSSSGMLPPALAPPVAPVALSSSFPPSASSASASSAGGAGFLPAMLGRSLAGKADAPPSEAPNLAGLAALVGTTAAAGTAAATPAAAKPTTAAAAAAAVLADGDGSDVAAAGGAGGGGGGAKRTKPPKQKWEEPTTQEGRVAMFKEMLKDRGVGPDAKWNDVLANIQKDQRFGFLKTAGERRQAFSEYTSQRSKEEREAAKRRAAASRTNFVALLHAKKDVIISMRYREAEVALAMESAWNAVADPHERMSLYEETMSEVVKEDRERKRVESEAKRAAFLDMLKRRTDVVSIEARWVDVKAAIADEPAYVAMDKDDRLDVYRDYILGLERELADKRRRELDEKRAAAKGVCEAILVQLRAAVAAGVVTFSTKWADLAAALEGGGDATDDGGQVAAAAAGGAGPPGADGAGDTAAATTAPPVTSLATLAAALRWRWRSLEALRKEAGGQGVKDLFLDVVDEAGRAYASDRRRIFAVFEEARIPGGFPDSVTADTTYDAWMEGAQAAAAKLPADSPVAAAFAEVVATRPWHLRAVFHDAHSRAVEARDAQEKRLRRSRERYEELLMDYFYRSDHVGTTWDEARGMLAHRSAFVEAPATHRQAWFEEYIARLRAKAEARKARMAAERERERAAAAAGSGVGHADGGSGAGGEANGDAGGSHGASGSAVGGGHGGAGREEGEEGEEGEAPRGRDLRSASGGGRADEAVGYKRRRDSRDDADLRTADDSKRARRDPDGRDATSRSRERGHDREWRDRHGSSDRGASRDAGDSRAHDSGGRR